MKLTSLLHFCAIFALIMPAATVKALDFKKDIQPILKDHCFKCHSGPKAKGNIRYDNEKYFKKVIGTHEHAVVIPGSPEKSKMYTLSSLPASDTNAMPPPRRGKPLNSAEQAMIRKWIQEGASLETKADEPVAATTPDPNKIHTWINTEGKKLNAAFVSASKTAVKLRKEDGSEFNYPLSKLSADSRKLASELASQ